MSNPGHWPAPLERRYWQGRIFAPMAYMAIGVFFRGRDMDSLVAEMQQRVQAGVVLPPGYFNQKLLAMWGVGQKPPFSAAWHRAKNPKHG